MAQSSVSRYRLAILAVTALAAGCSIYYIRENFWLDSSSSQGLRRRNAVHRPRPRRTRRDTGEPASVEPRAPVSRATIDAMLRVFDEQGPNYRYGDYESDIQGTFVSCELRRNTLASGTHLQEVFQLRPELAELVSRLIEQDFVRAMLTQLLGPANLIARAEMQHLRAELESRGLRQGAVHLATMSWTHSDEDISGYERSESGTTRRQSRPLGEGGGLRQHPPDDLIDFGQQIEGDLPSSEPVTQGSMLLPEQLDFSETVAGEEAEGLGTGTTGDDDSRREGQSLLKLLYYVAEDQSRKDGYVHRQVTCNQCNACPIRGIRYRCANCVDFDLCEQCEATQEHQPTHIFYKVRIPAPFPFLGNPRQPQPVWYPGKPLSLPLNLPRNMIQRFARASKFEDSEVAALWDQFRCLASQPWPNDPNHLRMAVDHSAFDKCFMPNTSLRSPPPNLIYDLMFSFYDTDGNGLIGFEEFVMGLACIREKGGKTNHNKLLRIFSGYDLDRDGYVCRKDFLRMFRAYYALMKELTREVIAGIEEDVLDNGQSTRDVATSSRPLSSVFHGSIHRGQPSRTGDGKSLDRFGDLILPLGQEITRETCDGEGDHHEAVADVVEQNSFGNLASAFNFERLHNLSRFATPDAIANIHYLGDRILSDIGLGNDSDGEEYTHDDDRYITGATGNMDHDENIQDETVTGAQRQWTDSSTWPPNWIDPSDAEKALGRKTQLKDVTDDADRSKVVRAAVERIAQENRDRRQNVRNEGISNRWQRRHFYLDEEDGATQPEGYKKELLASLDTENTDENANGQSTMNGHPRLSRRSRSSSKVRFEDDLLDEPCGTRSRSSTSVSSRSIPIGERWGGFEIPEPEKDVGREVLYQVTHEALNEMLDPIFKYREDLAMEILRTKAHRATSRLKEHYDRVPQLEKFVSAEIHELLRQWRTVPDKGPRGRQISISDFLVFLQDLVKEESVASTASNGFLLSMCQPFGLSQAQACFQSDSSKVPLQKSTSIKDQQPRDKRKGGSEPKANAGLVGEIPQQISDKEKQPLKNASPAYQDDPNVVYPEAALELQEAVTAFNEVDSAPSEATISSKPLSELLAESGYAVATPGAIDSSAATSEATISSAATPELKTSASLRTKDSTPDPTLPQNRPNSLNSPVAIASFDSNSSPDPTLPQNRPNSLPSGNSPDNVESQEKPGPSFLFSTTEPYKQTLPDGPIAPHVLKYYAFLDCIEKEDKKRGGPGRMNYEEFEEMMTSDRGRGLGFVGAWIDLASF